MDESNQTCFRFDSVRKMRWLRCVSFGEHSTAMLIQKWWRERKLRQANRELLCERASSARDVARVRFHWEAAA